ncbi:MAG: flagellar basal body P-ring protein FlgI [Firmicutes bacterium]|nr:flagellar basal body P-ring protein FlgI [Bacillota bacterium]
MDIMVARRIPTLTVVFLVILAGLMAVSQVGVLAQGDLAEAQFELVDREAAEAGEEAATEPNEQQGDLAAIPRVEPVAQSLIQPSVRLKDIARFDGIRENQLTGLGLVVGLDGTGDGKGAGVRMVANMLTRFGVTVDPQELRSRNIAAVMVTANLPPFARAGDRLDVTISSIGDAKSLQGGFLLQTPLQGADNQVYAVAQGPISIGGFNVRSGRNEAQKNHPTIARGPGIAIVEREVPGNGLPIEDGRLTLVLSTADFTTASRTAQEINSHFGSDIAHAQDSSSILLSIPPAYQRDVIGFMARVEEIQVAPDAAGRVVFNERTGTIVIGQAVRIAPVAVAHGNLSVTISSQKEVVQPPSFSQGETVTTETRTVKVQEDQGQLLLLPGAATIGDLVNVLNVIGATPRDIIAILQAIKESGALYGELEII